METNEVCTCAPGTKAGRTDTSCTACQNAVRRSTKRRDLYKAHGPCQTAITSASGRRAK